MIRLAFYGKGGIGKSTTVSNLSVYWAGRGLRVLQIGCDPKADSTIALRRGERIPTVMDKVRSGTPFALEDVITLWHPASDRAPSGGCVICAEAGGPLPGMGCAGRGIITALDKLGELGLYDTYEPDVVLYDVLGDVVCGGFAMPMRSGYAQKVYILTSGENMSIYAAANIAMALERFAGRGYASLGGLILNRRDVPCEDRKVSELAQDVHAPVIGALPCSPAVREAENRGAPLMELFPETEMAQTYRTLGDRIAQDCGIAYRA